MKKVKDHYYHKAKQHGFAARSVFKLEEIDQRHRLLKPGMKVLELGCSPGSWLQYVSGKIGPSGLLVGVDINPPTVSLGSGKGGADGPRIRIVQGDVFELKPDELCEGSIPFDVILSDMAPKTTGVKSADAARSSQLALRCLELATQVLRPGGSILVKVFQGADLPELQKRFREIFQTLSREKPQATRSESVEIFLLGKNRLF
ncbi:MAG: RlmE family RNA methyltransferase [Deltaproteobacteria bacterium]|nr:RlmE family RNA methyltransferase [Deltaproteobacteria bacterium]